MIGADTILLVRFLVKDVEDQAEQVKSILDEGGTIYINVIVLFELWWVLGNVYGYTKNEIILVIDLLLESEGIVFFDAGVVRKSLAEYIHSSDDFSSCLIHNLNRQQGIETLTMDDESGLQPLNASEG